MSKKKSERKDYFVLIENLTKKEQNKISAFVKHMLACYRKTIRVTEKQ